MTIKGNEMTVLRGETFTIDRTIVNRDGSPFIVSSEYQNPYLLLTVASTRYDEMPDGYKVNWWLNLDEMVGEDGNIVKLPRFKSTRPIQISKFDTESEELIGYEPLEDLFCVITDDGPMYKYFDEAGVWHEYEFRIIHHFLHSVTTEWIEQSYLYSIRLVAGLSMESYIKDLYKAVFDIDAPSHKTVEELYNEIKNKNVEYVKDLEVGRALATFDVVQDILVPTKLTVLSDLNGGL